MNRHHPYAGSYDGPRRGGGPSGNFGPGPDRSHNFERGGAPRGRGFGRGRGRGGGQHSGGHWAGYGNTGPYDQGPPQGDMGGYNNLYLPLYLITLCGIYFEFCCVIRPQRPPLQPFPVRALRAPGRLIVVFLASLVPQSVSTLIGFCIAFVTYVLERISSSIYEFCRGTGPSLSPRL